MRAVKSVSIDSERRVIITFLDGSTETLYPNCIWCDSEALRQLIKDLLEEKADAIVQTINNVAIATFADGADEALIRKLLVAIDPIQEGTGDPSPENVRPISGRTGLSVVRSGKNLIDDSVKIVSTSGMAFFVGDGSYNTYLLAGTYTISCKFNAGVHYALYMREENDSDNTTLWAFNSDLSQKTFTLSKNGHYRFWFYNTDVISPDSVNSIMLEFGSTSSDYEPYKGNTYSVDWETEAGTVYGGSLDIVSGKLTVDYFKYSPLSTYTPSQFVSLGTYTRVAYSGVAVKPGVNASAPYVGVYSHGSYDNRQWAGDYSHAFCTDMGVGYFYLPCEATASAIQAYLKSQEDAGTPVTVAYKIATPIEIQLTPQEITTLLGANNIWTDSGNILELEYVADTKLYIGESQHGTLGAGRQSISNTDLQPVSEKTVEDLSEAVKAETAEKETQEETYDERGE